MHACMYVCMYVYINVTHIQTCACVDTKRICIGTCLDMGACMYPLTWDTGEFGGYKVALGRVHG